MRLKKNRILQILKGPRSRERATRKEARRKGGRARPLGHKKRGDIKHT